jgi:hypothetical protein
MMVHDQLSGYVHEVPDQLMGPPLGEVIYNGLGDPVGWNPFQAIGRAVSGVGNLVRNVVGGGAGSAINSALQTPFNVIRGLLPGAPGVMPPPGVPMPYAPGGSVYPQQPYPPPPYGQQFPTGWTRPNLPYTGLGPRRMYMRCAVWPGPQGLVPGHAANMPAGFPGAPGMPGYPPFPGIGGGRRRRRRR